MYNNKLVATITVDNSHLREDNGKVFLPFGTEYSIYLKNLHTTNAVISITIDGQDILDGRSLILGPSSDMTLERYYASNNRFKFVERTAAIEKHRGIKPEDGIICISYQFEEQPPIYSITYYPWWQQVWPEAYWYYTSGGSQFCGNAINSIGNTCNADNSATHIYENSSIPTGITVPGSESNQMFIDTITPKLEPTKHSMCIQLIGIKDDILISKPKTTRQRDRYCSACGSVYKSRYAYCSNDGTRLKDVEDAPLKTIRQENEDQIA